MKNFFTPRNVMLPFIMGFVMNGFAQIAGDFQTKTAVGNWSDFSAWDVYNGSAWIAATPGQIPTSTTNVFVQTAQIISVDDAFAVCKDLNVNGATTSKIAFSTATSILNVKGDMNLYSTYHNCFDTWIAGAIIVFSGTGTQGFTNLSVNSVFVNIEVNKSSDTLSTSSNFRFGSFTLTAGNFSVASGNEIQGNSGISTININGGIWTQTTSTTRIYNSAIGNTSPIGAVIINGGMMALATTTGTGGFQFSTLNIINGGTLTLQNFSGNITIGASINIDATSKFNTALTSLTLPSSATFNGVVNYNHAGAQTISAATYSHLKLSGDSVKTLGAGTTIIPANGTLEMSGVATSPTLDSGGNTLSVSPVSTTLIYSSTANQTASTHEWKDNFQNVTVNNGAIVSMAAGLIKTINGALSLNSGTLNIGAGGSLSLNGPLVSTSGFMAGTNTSDLTVTGTTGSTVLLPLSGNISLRNVTISGNRTLQMNGTSNISLNKTFTIASGATYDNGGESQITGGTSISISGKFINRDKDNFTGTNGAITSDDISIALNPGCTIEYARTDNQNVTSRTDYKNITFSGSGTKTPSSSFTPTGTLSIAGSAILDATSHNIGDGAAGKTNFTMDGGKLILGATGTQPMMNGAYNLTGGLIQFTNSKATTQTIRSPKTYYAIEVTGVNVSNSSGNINLASNGSFTVKSGGEFNINADQITGSSGTQIVTVEAGAKFQCGNADGFSGGNGSTGNSASIKSDIETISLASGSTVNYMRSGNQTITNQIAYQNLTISGTGNKTAPLEDVLTIQGDLKKTTASVFVHNNGTVLFNGSLAQSYASINPQMIFNNLTNNNTAGLTINDSLSVYKELLLNAGSKINLVKDISLKSDNNNTANVAQIPSDATITYGATNGRFIVERYIPNHTKAWQLLAAPTKGSTVNQAWQEGNVPGGNTNPGYGATITSNRSTWTTEGFDLFSQAGPSMKTYDPATNSWVGIANTGISIANANGYMLFVRGDRSVTAYDQSATATTLHTRGKLYAPTPPGETPDTISLPANSFASVGNPYASAIKFENIISTGISNSYIIWDPKLTTAGSSAYGYGGFRTISGNVSVPSSDNYTDGNIPPIQSGQAFFVQTPVDSAGTVSFDENSKVAGSASIFRGGNTFTEPDAQLRGNLYVNYNDSEVLVDGILTQFHTDYASVLNAWDAVKISNTGENMGIVSNGKTLAIERRTLPSINDTLFYHLNHLKKQPYQFEFIATKFEISGLEAFLEDNYLHTKTPLNISGTTMINFTADDAAGSYAANRFYIVFKETEGSLPVTFTNVKAYLHNKNIVVEWKMENEKEIVDYTLEKSLDGIHFKKAAIVVAENNFPTTYQWLDVQPKAGYNYYRIKTTEQNGKTQYSQIVRVLMSNGKPSISIYPNPVKDGIINLQLENQPVGLYKAHLLNTAGQVILSIEINHANGSGSECLIFNKYVTHGIYHLEVTTPGGEKVVRKVAY